MKGQITALELVLVSIILFIAAVTLFPPFSYQTRWSDATMLLKGRDIILTIEGIGKLQDYAFNAANLKNFLITIFPQKNIIFWSETSGTLKSNLTVACNCTTQQINDLQNWFGKMKLNNREINVTFVDSPLDRIVHSDVLVIFGVRRLTQYAAQLENYLRTGSGVVYIAKLTQSDIDDGHRKIFGIDHCSVVLGDCGGKLSDHTIRAPDNVTDPAYQAYKFFYHFPLPVKTTGTAPAIPLEGGIEPCTQTNVPTGGIGIRDASYKFWICRNRVYLDWNQNDRADTIIAENQTFNITQNNKPYNFTLNYVERERILISFKPNFEFKQFAVADKFYPTDYNKNRILLTGGDFQGNLIRCTNPPCPIALAVVNRTLDGYAVWTTDPEANSATTDKQNLLSSLIFSSANRKTSELNLGAFRFGFLTTYLNVAGRDMLEIYEFRLGLGLPF
jgi:hypothetical protein